MNAEKELSAINEMLSDGQGDDDGSQILPDFKEGMSVSAKVEACVALLEYRRDVIDGSSRDHSWPEPTDKMLNNGQERMCQMMSRTVFEDHVQAEIYKTMVARDPAITRLKASLKLCSDMIRANGIDLQFTLEKADEALAVFSYARSWLPFSSAPRTGVSFDVLTSEGHTVRNVRFDGSDFVASPSEYRSGDFVSWSPPPPPRSHNPEGERT